MSVRRSIPVLAGCLSLGLVACASPFEPDPAGFAVALIEQGCLGPAPSLAGVAADQGMDESFFIGLPGIPQATAAWSRTVRGSEVRLLEAPGLCAVVAEDTDTGEVANLIGRRIGGLAPAVSGMPEIRIPGVLDFAMRSYTTAGPAPRRITVTSVGTAAGTGLGDNTLITVE